MLLKIFLWFFKLHFFYLIKKEGCTFVYRGSRSDEVLERGGANQYEDRCDRSCERILGNDGNFEGHVSTKGLKASSEQKVDGQELPIEAMETMIEVIEEVMTA